MIEACINIDDFLITIKKYLGNKERRKNENLNNLLCTLKLSATSHQSGGKN